MKIRATMKNLIVQVALLIAIFGTFLAIVSSSTALGATITEDATLGPGTSSYGEPCNTLQPCDSRARLECRNELCDCIRPNETIFEAETKKCVSKSGESCIVAIKNNEDSNYVFHVMGCVSNANCTSTGTCECGSKYFENANGTCSLALGHLETCQTEAQCSKYQHLHCRDGACQCDESVSIYPNDLEADEEPTCVGLAQKPCINSACTENAICTENICNCGEEFFRNEMGLCVPKVKPLGKCTESSQCQQASGQELICLEGICECNPDVSIYSRAQATIIYYEQGSYRNEWKENSKFHGFRGEYLTQCVGLVNSPCIDRRCTTNAFCSFPPSQPKEDERGTCKCQPEFNVTSSRTCASGFSTWCSSSSTCMYDLVCRNSKCNCTYDSQTFSEEKKMCLSAVGGPCSSHKSCKENAECKLLSKRGGVGHCTCKDGFAADFRGDCKADYCTSCFLASDCDSVANLQCVDQKCKCLTFSEYSFERRKCMGLVGATCDLKEEDVCTGNAFCKPDKSLRLQGTCTCMPQFQETNNYTCV